MGSHLSFAASQSPHRDGNTIISFDPEAGASAIPNAATYYFQSGAESSDSSALSNTGIRGTIGVVGTNVTGCVSYWVAEEMASNNVWGQVGYFLCDTNGITPTAFYQIWNSGGVAAGGSTSVTTGLHQFSMYLSSGTTWAYAVDGTVFGTVAMNSTASSSIYPIEALSEENYVSSPYSLPKVTFSSIQVLESGNWYSPVSGFEPNGCGSTGMSCWGVAGNLQNSTIPVDSFVVGGNTPLVNAGSFLWNTGSSPDFAVTSNPNHVKSIANFSANSTVAVTPIGSFSGTVNLTVNTNSSLVLCALSPTGITAGSGSSQVSCNSSKPGNYLVTVTASSGALSHTTTVDYQIEDYAITAQPTSLDGGPNAALLSTINIVSLNGFDGTVDLSVTSNSTELSCSLGSVSIPNASGSSSLSCTALVVGNYLATVIATNSSLSHEAFVVYQIASGRGSVATTTFYFELGAAILVLTILSAMLIHRSRKRRAREPAQS